MEALSRQFDRLFESVVVSEGPAPEPCDAPRKRRKPTPDEETRIRRAMALFHRGEYQACIEAMHKLKADSVVDCRVEAFISAARAVGLGDTAAGLKSCVEAVKKAGPVADVYCALGAVLLDIGDKGRAHAAFRRGLAFDPLHPHLRARVRTMGVRQPPVLQSLPRRHPLNRLLGTLRAKLAAS